MRCIGATFTPGDRGPSRCAGRARYGGLCEDCISINEDEDRAQDRRSYEVFRAAMEYELYTARHTYTPGAGHALTSALLDACRAYRTATEGDR